MGRLALFASSSKLDAQNRTSRRGSIAANRAITTLSSPVESGAVLLCQDPNYPLPRDRSGGEAVAVRDHSLSPRPVGAGKRGAQGPLATRQAFDLTPTRWGAKRVAASLGGPAGSGGAVLARTATEPPQNRQPLEIVTNCVRFSRFYAVASRDAHAPVCVQPRVYARGVNHRTIEPLLYKYILQEVGGSVAVLWRFWSEPAPCASLDPRGLLPLPNKLGGRYCGSLAELVPIKASSTVVRGWRAESFGDFGGGGGLGEVDARGGGLGRRADRVGLVVQGVVELVEVGAVRNGGVLRFLGWSAGRVGRVMLEGGALRPGVAWFVSERPLPVSLGAGREAGGGSIRAEAPPSPPAPPSRAGIPLALAAGRIWIGLPAAGAHYRNRRSEQKIAKKGTAATGRGWPGWVAAGRQRRAGVQAEGLEGREPRENGHASAGGSHVNR